MGEIVVKWVKDNRVELRLRLCILDLIFINLGEKNNNYLYNATHEYL